MTSSTATRAKFGDYISVYGIQRAVQDGATVPIYCESRFAKLALVDSERPKIEPGFEEANEGEEVERKEKNKSKWALVAKHIVKHFEKRCDAMDGKAMIVCMSRRICVELYREIVKLQPDNPKHIRNNPRREAVANRFRDPNDAFKLALVRDMRPTGFDTPSL